MRSKTLVAWLAAGVLLLHALNLAAQIARLSLHLEGRWWLVLVDVDAEANLPTWFSSMLLLCASNVAARYAPIAESREERRGWRLLSLVFLLFSADEVARLHEQLAAGILVFLRAHHVAREWLWALGALLVAIFALVTMPFLSKLERTLRRQVLFAGAMFVTGGLVLEALGHAYAARFGWANPTYLTLSALEELLEMLGVLRFVQVVGRALEAKGLAFSEG